MKTIPSMTLNNGVELPAIGLGVFLSPPSETAETVEGLNLEDITR
jgi:diketogulonate reductase-like aldo/keto reductase